MVQDEWKRRVRHNRLECGIIRGAFGVDLPVGEISVVWGVWSINHH